MLNRTFFLMILFAIWSLSSFAQTLKKATSGSGLYKDHIYWLDFDGVELDDGDSIVQTYAVNSNITLILKIKNVLFSGTLINNTSMSLQRLVGYTSGTYGGDGLVNLYNIGVPNNGADHTDRAQNTLMNALSFKYDGGGYTLNVEALANFTIEAYAYFNNTLDPVDVGMVFASAETDEPYLGLNEYTQGTTNGNPWQIFETALFDLDGEQKVEISNSGLTARVTCGFNGYSWSPGNSILMYTWKPNTTSTNQLSVDMEFMGGGKSAIALGFLLTSIDKGDAPSLYGNPENYFFTRVLGGTPSSAGTYYISSNGLLGGSNTITTGTLGFSQAPRLGNQAGDPDEHVTVTNTLANADNLDGVNDEDALTTPIRLTTRDEELAITFSATPETGQDAFVNGWLDIDRSGTFDAGEFKSTTINSATNVNFTWSGLQPLAGTTYLRLRIQSNVLGSSTGSADAKMGGETEDYLIDVTTFITGNILHDADGLLGTNPNTVDGSPIHTVENQQLYVTLMDGNTVIDQVPVQQDGTYEFDNVYVGNYELVLTTQVNGTTPSLPTDWVFTGEQIASNSPDGSPNGRIAVNIAAGSTEVNNVNFGINERPNSDDVTVNIDSPNPLDILQIGVGDLPNFTGNDLEDGDYEATTGSVNQPYGIVITSLATNGVLYYKGQPVAIGDTIKDFQSQDLHILLTGSGYTNTTFEFAYLDQANFVDLSPASYSINWSIALPVELVDFSATHNGQSVQLHWATLSELDNKGFGIEKSKNGKDWYQIGFINSMYQDGARTTNYTFVDDNDIKGLNYYRLKQVDFKGTFQYSYVVKLAINNTVNAVTIYPNPTNAIVSIEGVNSITQIVVLDAKGQQLINRLNESSTIQLDVSSLANGMYYLHLIDINGAVQAYPIIKN